MNRQQFLTYLCHKKLLTSMQMQQLQQESRDPCLVIVERDWCDSNKLATLLARDFALPLIDCSTVEIDKTKADLINEHQALPYFANKQFYVVVYNPNNQQALFAFEKAFQQKGQLALCDVDTFLRHSQQQQSNDSSAQQFVDDLLAKAIKQQASDIHIEPQQQKLIIRLRIDGLLSISHQLDKKQHTAIINRFKIMANLDISEQRLPQDGQITLNKMISCRISTCPTLFGEKLVCRLLRQQQLPSITELGFNDEQLQQFKHAIEQPQGLILVTGPTGSGKTTTLYAALSHLRSPQKNICSVEDPVEMHIKGINQIHVREQIGLSFSTILRSLLRQDPDIIMIGEIRDETSAQIAIRAAQTGHLVLATLHANNCLETLTRLRFMGIREDLIAHSLNIVIAQRLLRQSAGGRQAIFECLSFDKETQQHCLKNETISMQNTLQQQAQALIKQQIITVEEMSRVIKT